MRSALLLGVLLLAAVPARAQPCRPGMRFGPEARRCRTEPPPFLTTRIGLDTSVGLWDRDVPVDHVAAGVGIPIDLRIIGPLWVGARAGFMVGGDAGQDADGDGFDDDNDRNPKAFVLTAGPRLVIDTEPSRQEAWRFGVSGGVLVPIGDGDDGGPVVEAAVERQWGVLLADHSEGTPTHGRGQDFSLGIRAQQGVGAASEYRALSFTLTYATELFARLPEGSAPERERPDVEHTVSAEMLAGTGFGRGGFAQGIGLALGLPFGRIVELRARGDVVRLAGTELNEGAVVLGALGGVRLSRWYLPWVEVLFGYGHAFGTEPTAVASSPVLDIGMGGQFPNALGCGYGLSIGQRVRFGFHDGDRRLVTILFGLGITYDSLIRARECWP